MNKLKFVLAVAATAVTFGAFATDGYLKDMTSGTVNWKDASRWQGKNGETLAAAPLTADDNACIVDDGMQVRRRSLSFDGAHNGGDGSYPDVTIGSVTGSFLNTIRWQDYYNDQTGNHAKAYTLTLLDPSGFLGFWEVTGASAVFSLPAGGDDEPTLAHLGSRRFPQVAVPTAGTTAKVADLYQGGAMEKRGPGTLKVDLVQTGRPRIYVREGAVSLTGDPATGKSALETALAKAAIHLDASVASSLVTGTDAEGRTTVERWNDVRGAGYPYSKVPTDDDLKTTRSSAIKHANAPFLNRDEPSPTGLPVVDFGWHGNEEGFTTGLTDSFHIFSAPLEGIREVFYAIVRPNDLNGVPVLGALDDDAERMALAFYPGSTDFLYENYAKASVYKGDIRVDGEHVANNSFRYTTEYRTRMHVAGIGTTDGVTSGALACERRIPNKVGGMRIGELLVFTEPLTVAERTAIDGYLVGKWEDSAKARVASAVFLDEGTSIDVPEGRTAYVSQLVVGKNAATKTGGGTLRVGRLYAEGTGFSVTAGAVELEKADVIPTDAPAARPWIWLDATDGGSIVGDASGVTRWNDTRLDKDAAAVNYAISSGDVLPTVVAAACGTKSVVDFGKDATGTWMDFNRKGSMFARAVYMVVRMKALGKQNLFGSSSREGRRSSSVSSALLTSDIYMNPKMLAAQWTINGEPVDPRVPCAALNQTDDFFVVGFSASEAVMIDKLFRDWNETGNEQKGRFQLGEYLLYDRVLSEDESRRTQAYLMNRWLGKPHPENTGSASIGTVAFDVNSPIRISADYDLEIGLATGGNGTVEKDGVGMAKVVLPAENLSAAVVKSGTLDLGLRMPFEDKALFHFDASDTNSFTTYESVDAWDGVKRTHIKEWADVRRNGIVATSTKIWASKTSGISWRYAAMNKADPELVQAETAEGRLMPAVSFGDRIDSTTGDTLKWPTNTSSFTLPQSYAVRDVFTVYADTDANGGIGFVIGNKEQAWMRNSAQLLHDTYTSEDARAAFFSWNGDGTTYRYKLKHGQFYVLCYGTKEGADPIQIDAICQDRNANAGGGTVCEQIAFAENLSADERAQISQYLMAKWLRKAVSPLSAANIDFSFAFDGRGEMGALRINQPFDFSEGASFTFSALNRAMMPGEGKWPFLEFLDVTGFDASKISVVNELPRKRDVTVSLEGNVLYISYDKPGMLMLVR